VSKINVPRIAFLETTQIIALPVSESNRNEGKFYNVVSQIGKPDCRGGDRRRKRERIEIERGRKSKKERHAPEGASRLKQVKMALQSVV
jgi:hypothetical protein